MAKADGQRELSGCKNKQCCQRIVQGQVMIELTGKQQAVLNYINDTIKDLGYSPTIREIGDNFGITVKGAYDHINSLKKKGYITMTPDRARTIRVLK